MTRSSWKPGFSPCRYPSGRARAGAGTAPTPTHLPDSPGSPPDRRCATESTRGPAPARRPASAVAGPAGGEDVGSRSAILKIDSHIADDAQPRFTIRRTQVEHLDRDEARR